MKSFKDLQRQYLPMCTYCEDPATERDHVPPKSMVRYSTTTVPSCRRCNNILRNLLLLDVKARKEYIADWHARHYKSGDYGGR